MARYIVADKAIFELGIEDWEIDCKYFIEEQPTADVAEVVRCKDCKYKIKNAWGLGIICDKIGTYMPTENDFCSYGKKVE